MLLSISATAILALIAINVNIANDGAMTVIVKLGSIEALSAGEIGTDCWDGTPGACATRSTVLFSGDDLYSIFECIMGDGIWCQEGFQCLSASGETTTEILSIHC